MLSDCHMHTKFSLDSEADPEAMVESAIAEGLQSVCITDHEDRDYISEGNQWTFDADQYFAYMGRVCNPIWESITKTTLGRSPLIL